MLNATTDFPMDSMVLEDTVPHLQDRLQRLASRPRGFLAVFTSFLRAVPTMLRLREVTALVARHYVRDVSAASAKETYRRIVELRDSVREGEVLAGSNVAFLPAKIFLTRQRQSLEDTIEAWDMGMDSDFRDMIYSRLQEVSEARNESTERQSDMSLR